MEYSESKDNVFVITLMCEEYCIFFPKLPVYRMNSENVEVNPSFAIMNLLGSIMEFEFLYQFLSVSDFKK